MQIISNRQILFQKHDYKERQMKDAFGERTELVSNVTDKILVVASTRPQIVPDWIKETREFAIYLEDGSIMVLAENFKASLPNPVDQSVKGIENKQETPKATFADEKQDNAPATGWGANPTNANWGIGS